jgi:carbon-monoxide dehydrogenase medium subunit
LLVTDAELEIARSGSRRRVALKDFVRGAMETDLGHDELLVKISVPKVGQSARHGFHKICRKTGEFADAIGAVAVDTDSDRFCMVAAGGSEMPVRFETSEKLFKQGDPSDPDSFDMDSAMNALREAGMDDEYELRLRAVAMNRAHRDAIQT